MTLSLNIGNLFNDSSSHALVDELRKRTSEEDILEFEEKFNAQNERNLHIYICRFFSFLELNFSSNSNISSSDVLFLSSSTKAWLEESLNKFPIFRLNVINSLCPYLRGSHKLNF